MQKSSSRGKLSSQGSKTARGRKELQEEVAIDVDEGPVYVKLAWQIVSEELLTEMAKLNIEDVAMYALYSPIICNSTCVHSFSKLAGVLSYTNHKECLREAALLDVYVAAYWFGKEQKLSSQQLSGFFTVLHKLMGNCKSGMNMMDNIEEFQKLLVGAGMMEKCPLGQFSKDQAKWLTEYVMSSLFQHYCLYQYLLCEQQDEETISMKFPICIPPSCSSLMIPPLEEAIPEQLYLECINPPPSVEADNILESATQPAQEITVDSDILDGVSAGEVKGVLDKIAAGAIANFENEVIQKIKDKEKSIIKQLNQFEKAIK